MSEQELFVDAGHEIAIDVSSLSQMIDKLIEMLDSVLSPFSAANEENCGSGSTNV